MLLGFSLYVLRYGSGVFKFIGIILLLGGFALASELFLKAFQSLNP